MKRLSATPGSLGPSESITGRSRVCLTPGHSLMDWIRLGRERGDLSGVGSRKKEVTTEELATHNTEKDLWMAIKGKVYNVTPYMHFHPGGVAELMRTAGKDGTQLFEEIHSWVNVESMMSKCVVGPYVGSEPPTSKLKTKPRLSISFQPPPILPTDQPSPTYDWYQSSEALVVVVYTKVPDMQANQVVVDVVTSQEVLIEAYLLTEYTYFIHLKLHDRVEDSCKVTVKREKVEIAFKKKNEKNWPLLGQPLKLNKVFVKSKYAEPRFWQWTAVSNTEVTHNTRLIGLKCSTATHMCVPIGYHFIIHHSIEGMELARSYTVVLPSLLRDPVTIPSATEVPSKDRLVYLMVKSYVGGAISPWITAIRPGDKVKMNRFDGNLDIRRLKDLSHLVMFAAGTGFTSMIRIIYHTLHEMPLSNTKVSLVFYNKSKEDILWNDQLHQLTNAYPRFSVTYVLSQPKDEAWSGPRGRVCREHIEEFVPKPVGNKLLLLVCGQFAYNQTVERLAKEWGLQDTQIHMFGSSS